MRRVALSVAAATLVYATPARAYHEGDERLVDGTAHTLRAGEARVGLWELELAPVAFATVGTDTAPWAASLVVQSLVVNGHAKVRVVHSPLLTLSLGAAVYHADVPSSGSLVSGKGSVLLVPLSLFASSDVSHSTSLHLGVTYARASGDDLDLQVGSYRARGAMAASALQLHAMGEYRVSRVVALTLQLHAQPYSSPASVQTTTTDSYGDQIDFSGTAGPVDRTAFAAVASVVVSGKYLTARFGGGYGAIFLPSMGVAIPYTTVLPELDIYVRF
ncbi:MAG: hypothetical protein JWP87_5451 [Labilithrix sp.]|nr:hypothetical protein [Labilithrix sp.]